MKKVLLLLIIFAVMISGCTQNQPDSAADDQPAETQVEETTGPVETTDISLEPTIEVEETSIPPISEWCIVGYTYDVSTDQASTSATIEEITTYKGQEFCKGSSITHVAGMDVETTYYFTYEAKEVWVISSVAGQTTETHIIDEKIVE